MIFALHKLSIEKRAALFVENMKKEKKKKKKAGCTHTLIPQRNTQSIKTFIAAVQSNFEMVARVCVSNTSFFKK